MTAGEDAAPCLPFDEEPERFVQDLVDVVLHGYLPWATSGRDTPPGDRGRGAVLRRLRPFGLPRGGVLGGVCCVEVDDPVGEAGQLR